MITRDGGRDASPTEKTRETVPSSHAPIRAERSTPISQPHPPGRNKTARPRNGARGRPLQQRPLNRKALGDRLELPPIPQQTTNYPEKPVERGKHNGQTSPKDGDTRIDDEPLHHEAHGTSASVATTRKPAPGPHATRVVERARKRNTVAKTHFRSDLSNLVD